MVVDDEPSVAHSVAYTLRKEGYEVTTASDGASALAAAEAHPPALVILDLMLPGIDGLEVCRRLRRTSSVPILMLTARSEEMDRVIGLEVGADDYLSKPFSMRELVARVRALLRRYTLIQEELKAATDSGRLEAGDLAIDVAAHRALLGGKEIPLTPKEFALLATLVRNRGQVLPAQRLLELVWGYTDSDSRTVTVHIRTLREKIEKDPSRPIRLETVRGVGYRYRG